jgi:ATP-dependent DNA helicase PIF1
MKEPLVLDKAFQDILQQLEHTDDHYFVTGRAGTGKSTLLQLFRKTTHKKCVVLSPTGIAALNVQGQTIHSFFQFAPKLQHPKELFLVRRLVNLMKALELLIIDEISMVRADVLDAMDYSLRLHRQNALPFGGVQMIFFGDLFQLPPVVSSAEEKNYFSTYYEGPYFFHAHVWKQDLHMRMIQLTKVYRQKERHFINLLEAIRNRDIDYETIEELNARYLPEVEIQEPYLTLCSTNAATQQINADRLQKILSPSFFYHAEVQGDFAPNMFPTDYKLELREGAQLMMIRNDPEKRFVNGTLATIVGLEENRIIVRFGDQAEEVSIPQMTWEITRYKYNATEGSNIESEVVGSFKQYPVRLAWAVTIHKSQGQTYDRVAIDLGRGAFEHGQTYVALSRCRTLEGVFLKKPLKGNDILVDERIAEFYSRMR